MKRESNLGDPADILLPAEICLNAMGGDRKPFFLHSFFQSSDAARQL
jgi:hypothetical protein